MRASSTREGPWVFEVRTSSASEGRWVCEVRTSSTREGQWVVEVRTSSAREGQWVFDVRTSSAMEGHKWRGVRGLGIGWARTGQSASVRGVRMSPSSQIVSVASVSGTPLMIMDVSMMVAVASRGRGRALTLFVIIWLRRRLMKTMIAARIRNPPTPTATPTAIATLFVLPTKPFISDSTLMLTALIEEMPN